MFDTTCADKANFTVPASFFHSYQPIARLPQVGVLSWQEHCVECGQPECFCSCPKYQRSFDGKCRRFKSGIVPIRSNGFLFYGCDFKQWGKLEAVFTGRIWSQCMERHASYYDLLLATFVRFINRAMSFIPGRIGAISIYRRFKLWGSRLFPGNRGRCVDGLFIHVWSECSVKIHLVIIEGNTELFSTLIELKKGWNEQQLAIPEIRAGARLLLFSTEKDEFKLIFDQLAVVPQSRYAPVSSVSEKVAEYAPFIKCVAWDLDNTLWHGILVEDGVDKLQLNNEAVRVIKALDERGIVHSILSKNDFQPAWEALKKFSLDEYFIFPYINWNQKSENLKAMARTININLNTFAFIDDSPFERGDVSENCPHVRVFTEKDIPLLLDKPEFNPPISEESKKRRLSYKREMERVKAAEVFAGNYKDFLKSCNIKLDYFDLKDAHEADYTRCFELIQRSNQLTLTGNRYSEADFKKLVATEHMAIGIRCSDKFGDYGIVGTIIVSDEGKGVWRIKEFVMSCRVAKKGCELMAVNHIRAELKSCGGNHLKATIVDTGRNGALREAFKEIAFD